MDRKVDFNQNSIVKINDKIISDIKVKAGKNHDGRYRFCLQHSPHDSLHEMFIVRSKNDYGRPDKHLYTTESHMIIDGEMQVVLFEDDGRIKDVFRLSKDNYFSYRIDTNIYHMQIPLTDQVVYYEIKSGPFTDESNIFPSWAPKPEERQEVAVFMQQLEKKIRDFVLSRDG